MAAADGSLTKHGFPRGYRFVPTSLELISILSDQIRGRALPPPLHTIFHDVRILDYHPEELYGINLTPSLPPPEPSPDFISLSLTYKEDAEHHYKEDAERYKEDAAPGDKNRGWCAWPRAADGRPRAATRTCGGREGGAASSLGASRGVQTHGQLAAATATVVPPSPPAGARRRRRDARRAAARTADHDQRDRGDADHAACDPSGG